MATTYTPDPTATQAPAAAPDPDNFPLSTLPAAGDGATAASVAQGYKVLGDYIAWLKAPRSKASAWAQRLRSYLNARLQRRSIVDHLGFLRGNVQGVDERWDATDAGTFGTDLRWTRVVGSGSVQIRGVGIPSGTFGVGGTGPITTLFRTVQMYPPFASGGAYVSMQRAAGLCVPDANMAVVMEVPVALTLVGANNIKVLVGILSANSNPGSVSFGAWFEKLETDTNWQARVDGVGSVDTTVPPVAGTHQRMRIEIVGTGTSDDSTARVLFFINDTQVANVAHAVTPTGGDELVPFFGAQTQTVTGGPTALFVGPVSYRQNMFQTV